MDGVIIKVGIYEEIRKVHLNATSQRRIALKLGISRETVKKYYNGDTSPWVRKEYERPADIIANSVKDFILGCIKKDQAESLKKTEAYI